MRPVVVFRIERGRGNGIGLPDMARMRLKETSWYTQWSYEGPVISEIADKGWHPK